MTFAAVGDAPGQWRRSATSSLASTASAEPTPAAPRASRGARCVDGGGRPRATVHGVERRRLLAAPDLHVTVNGASASRRRSRSPASRRASRVARVTCTGPRFARRQLRITIDAQQAVTVTVRLRRAGVTVQRKTVVEEEAGRFRITMNIGNGKRPGYTAQVTIRNDFGATSADPERQAQDASCR